MIEPVLSLGLIGAFAVASVMTLLWWLGVQRHNFGYVDIGWAVNFMLLAAIYGWFGSGDPGRKVLICGMFGLWSLRLTLHLLARIVGKPEEGRYVQLRREWAGTGRLNLKFFGFFQFQALLNVILSLPILLAVSNAAPRVLGWETAGLLVWSLGLAGEAIADWQLARFKRDPAKRGTVCSQGLWGWSRHPNYFFEWVIWIGYALFALGSPYGWLCLALPLLMLYFLLCVTGVKPTEEQGLRSKGVAYRDYQRRVSAFVPLPPRK
jgi:steroid 5-alpha reductase family enzyme